MPIVEEDKLITKILLELKDELRRIKLIEDIIFYQITWIKKYNSSISYSQEEIDYMFKRYNNYTTPKLKETLAKYVYKLSKLSEYEDRFI